MTDASLCSKRVRQRRRWFTAFIWGPSNHGQLVAVNLPTEDLTWQPCRCWEVWVGPVLVDVQTVGMSVETCLGFVLSRDT